MFFHLLKHLNKRQAIRQFDTNVNNSSTIHLSTEQHNSKNCVNDGCDDDENMDLDVLEQIHAAENCYLEKNKTKILTEEEAFDKNKQPPLLQVATVSTETKEKRQRSLLDYLDQSYFGDEMPISKMKRESHPSSCNSIDAQQKTNTTTEENCCESQTISEKCDNVEQINQDSETNINLKDQTDKLKSLHVVSETNSTESTLESSPDNIPSTAPA